MLSSTHFSGCCAARIHYNIGMAHGHPRAKSVYEFATWLQKAGLATVNVIITNSQQDVERDYLDQLGFTYQTVGSLRVHTGAINTVRSSKPFLEASAKLAEEAKKIRAKQLAFQRQREEQLRRQRERRQQANMNFRPNPVEWAARCRRTNLPLESTTPLCTMDWVNRRRRDGDLSADDLRRVVRNQFGVDVKFRYRLSGYMYTDIVVGIINSAIKRAHTRRVNEAYRALTTKPSPAKTKATKLANETTIPLPLGA